MTRLLLRLAPFAAAVLLLAAVMAYLAGLFHEKLPTDPRELSVPPVDGVVVEAEAVVEPLVEEAAGTVQAEAEALISARILATVLEVPVRAGDRVERGRVLVELDRRDLEARVEQHEQAVAAARAQGADAESHFRRVRPLVERGVASPAELDRARAARDTAVAELARAERAAEEARTALTFATITAPFSGRVVERYAEPGDTASPGVPLLKLYDPAHLRLEAFVRESLAARIAEGDTLEVRIDALEETLAVQVHEIVPAADPGARAFLVKASLPDHPGLYPGMFGRLRIPAGEVRRLYVPEAAVVRTGQLELVTVLDDEGRAVRRFVRTGRHTPDGRIEIRSGLREGERVIVAGSQGTASGREAPAGWPMALAGER